MRKDCILILRVLQSKLLVSFKALHVVFGSVFNYLIPCKER